MDAPQCSYCISTWKAHEQPWTGRLSQHTATWLRPACSHCSHTICPLICGTWLFTISWSWWCPTICDKYMRLNMSIINNLTQSLTQKFPDHRNQGPCLRPNKAWPRHYSLREAWNCKLRRLPWFQTPTSPNLNPCDIPLWLINRDPNNSLL